MWMRLSPGIPIAVLLIASIAASGCSESPENQFLSAVTRNDVALVVRVLGDCQVDVNYQTRLTGETALATAAGLGYVEIVRLLLDRGAEINVRNSKGMTPLLMAAHGGRTEIVSMLIKAGADVDTPEREYGFTPLIVASSKGHAETVEALLDAGADENIRANNGLTALQLARDSGHEAVVKLLVGIRPTLQ